MTSGTASSSLVRLRFRNVDDLGQLFSVEFLSACQRGSRLRYSMLSCALLGLSMDLPDYTGVVG
jgi:hypothetical protein